MIKISSSGEKLRFESQIILIWIMFLSCNSVHCRNSIFQSIKTSVFVKSNWSMKWIWSLDHSFSLFRALNCDTVMSLLRIANLLVIFGTFLVLYNAWWWSFSKLSRSNIYENNKSFNSFGDKGKLNVASDSFKVYPPKLSRLVWGFA